jgi:diguanylate cyclase (GGDEF)-like protein
VLDPADFPEGFRDFVKGLLYYVQSVREASVLASDIAQGELDTNPLSPGNEVAAGLKSLQASLRHLTWQTQQIAKGDYQQHVSFMGNFSEAMNNMVEQLAERRYALEAAMEAQELKSQALQRSIAVFEDITAQMSQLIIVLNKDTKEELLRNHPLDQVLLEPATEGQLFEWLGEQLSSDRCSLKVTRDMDLTFEGGFQSFSVQQHPYIWGEHEAVVFIFTDTTASRRAFLRLEKIAKYDPLTNAYSRHFGMMLFNQWLEQRQRFSLCFIDLDNLKYVNDRLGHNEGDKYILLVAQLLGSFSEDAVLCRLGGDEFMLLARDWGEEESERRLEVLRSKLVADNGKRKSTYNRSMSYGVVEVGANDDLHASELLGMADEKMYFYKRAHKAERTQ